MISIVLPEKLVTIKDSSQKQVKLFNTLCQILFTRKKINLRPFKLYTLGLRKFEIAELLGMNPADVTRSIDSTIKALRDKYEEYERTPKGLVPLKWIKLDPKTKKVVELYLSGNDNKEIQVSPEINLKTIEQVQKYLKVAMGILDITPLKLSELRKPCISVKVA